MCQEKEHPPLLYRAVTKAGDWDFIPRHQNSEGAKQTKLASEQLGRGNEEKKQDVFCAACPGHQTASYNSVAVQFPVGLVAFSETTSQFENI